MMYVSVSNMTLLLPIDAHMTITSRINIKSFYMYTW